MSAKAPDTGSKDSRDASKSDDYPLRAKIAMAVVAGAPPVSQKMCSRNGCRHNLRKANVFAWIHFKVQVEGILCVRLDHFLHEFHENGVFAKDCVLVHRLKID